jgi:hypothetical protein
LCDDKYDKENAIEYKKSVTFRKIADLHRYGFRMAEKFVKRNIDNCYTLYAFINLWDKFCKDNHAGELNNYYKGITFKIYKDKGKISWSAILEPLYGLGNEIKRVKLNENNIGSFSFEDDCFFPQPNY